MSDHTQAATTVTYGWDASHYDGKLTKAIMVKAKGEGIQFFTHKLGEGLGNIDAEQATALAAARDAGILAIGGYWFVHANDDPTAEAKKCIATADAHEAWWRDFDGWFWQTDAEISSTGLPSAAHVKKFSDELASRSGRTVIVYASHGMYGNKLTGLGHPLWNANYPSSRQAGFKSLYPGNGYSGWNTYSGQTPVMCQYTSSATIAGLTTCDANAFRGSIDDLLDRIGALGMTPAQLEAAITAGMKKALADPATAKALAANLMAADVIPAAQPPFENGDWWPTPATGTTPAVPGNTKWTIGYWLRDIMQRMRGEVYTPPAQRPTNSGTPIALDPADEGDAAK